MWYLWNLYGAYSCYTEITWPAVAPNYKWNICGIIHQYKAFNMMCAVTSQRNINMPVCMFSSSVTLSARLSLVERGLKSSSLTSKPRLSCVHTSISSWQYANVQPSPNLHTWLSNTSTHTRHIKVLVHQSLTS